MAVFLINICKFNGCGIKFSSLSDLIQHIEDTHIDFDPHVIVQKEQDQPHHLPLSYVLPFVTDAARKDPPFLGTTTSSVELKRKLAIKHHSYSMSSSNRSTTPTGSEIDDEELVISEFEDSNDSWTTEEFSSEFIMRYGSRHSSTTGPNGLNSSNEKPFACPVPGCKKRYKNVNGIKYHSKNGHKKDGKIRKGFKCHCGKSYKTSQGLKNHSMCTHHNSSSSISNDASNSSSSTQLSLSHSPSTITTNSTIFSNSNANMNSTITSSLTTSPNIINNNSPNTPTTPTASMNNLNLVTIKSKPSAVGLKTTKLLKLISNDGLNDQMKTLDNSKNLLPNLVAPSLSSNPQSNLININNNNNNSNKIENNNFPLTPVQSPKLPTQNAAQQSPLLQHQQNINKKNDNLPLTPISQNTNKTNNIFDKSNDNMKILTNSSET